MKFAGHEELEAFLEINPENDPILGKFNSFTAHSIRETDLGSRTDDQYSQQISNSPQQRQRKERTPDQQEFLEKLRLQREKESRESAQWASHA